MRDGILIFVDNKLDCANSVNVLVSKGNVDTGSVEFRRSCVGLIDWGRDICIEIVSDDWIDLQGPAVLNTARGAIRVDLEEFAVAVGHADRVCIYLHAVEFFGIFMVLTANGRARISVRNVTANMEHIAAVREAFGAKVFAN
ncbi:hypothetical protein LJC53_02930 [Bacteroidales bacterium OttesenSCG-928-C03]|nr:hypothetical protein [Bacteroidales bacterium OttesenSCG-928-C03]MDL2326146.1 hypothetical protein [Bacteroidales bacterium OttesenSCG-928-A14]